MVVSENKGDDIPQEPLPNPDDELPPSDQPDMEPQISLHALNGILSPQNLKLIG